MVQDETNLNTDIKKEEEGVNETVQVEAVLPETEPTEVASEATKPEVIEPTVVPETEPIVSPETPIAEPEELIIESETPITKQEEPATVEPATETHKPKVEEVVKEEENKPQEISTPTSSVPVEKNKIPKIEETPTQAPQIDEKGILKKFLSSILNKANTAIQGRNKKRLEALEIFFQNNPRVTNNMVEKLLKVSDATATRYLKKLLKQGKIIQHGARGSKVFYTKI